MIAKLFPYFQFSPEIVSDTLSFFTASLRTAKGIEKNIIAKKCLEKISYAPDQISFSFWLQPDSPLEPDSKNNAPRSLIEKNNGAKNNELPILRENRESANFVLERVGGIEPPSSDWQPPIITIIRYPQN